jgi:hypothetical protein
MQTVLATLRDAGGIGWVIVVVGAIGALAALGAALAVALRAKGALGFAVAVTALGVLCAGLGGTGVVRARMATDRAIGESAEDLRPVERQRVRREGYLTARSAAKLGLGGAALPLLAGVAAAFVAARRKARIEAPPPDAIDGEIAFAPRPRRGLPVGAALAALASSGFALAALLEPVPGRNLHADQDARHILDQFEDIRYAAESDVVLTACRRLEDDLYGQPASFDRALVPGLPAVARRCVEERIQRAAILSRIGAVEVAIEAISRSSFVQHDAQLGHLVDAAREEIRRIAASLPAFDVL